MPGATDCSIATSIRACWSYANTGTKQNDPVRENYATSRDKQPGAGPDDGVRIDYIREHLREVARCLRAGLNVRGYYYWSLLDTYESTSGRRFCFGLAQVDYETLARTRRKSWHYYRECIAQNTAVP